MQELQGVYRRGMWRAWKITFPYSTDKIFLFFGSGEDAVKEAEKIRLETKYMYAAKVKEITKRIDD